MFSNNNKHIKKIHMTLIVVTISTNLINPLIPTTSYADNYNYNKIKTKGDLVIKNSHFTSPRNEPNPLKNQTIENAISKMNSEKSQGIFDKEGTKISTSDDFNFQSGEIKMVAKNQRDPMKVSEQLRLKMNKAGYATQAQALAADKNYASVVKDDLATKWDVRTGPIWTPKDWHKMIDEGGITSKTKTYSDKNGTKTMDSKEKIKEVATAIYKTAAKKAKEGKPISPDFLMAMSMNETGWGTNKYSERNSWFSVGAFTSNPDNAYNFDSVEAATEQVIDMLWKNYLSPDGPYYSPEYGPSIMGMNVRYADWGNGMTNFQWSLTATSIMRKVAKSSGKKYPFGM